MTPFFSVTRPLVLHAWARWVVLNERREGVILDGIDAAARPKVKDGMMEMRRSCGQNGIMMI